MAKVWDRVGFRFGSGSGILDTFLALDYFIVTHLQVSEADEVGVNYKHQAVQSLF